MTLNVYVTSGDPRDLIPADVNARFMVDETFARLVDTLRADQTLTEMPFVWLDVETDTRHILSGHHRVKAAIAAGLETISWQETDAPMAPHERTARQLAANKIVGEDDPEILAEMLADLDEEMRDLAGFSTEDVEAVHVEFDARVGSSGPDIADEPDDGLGVTTTVMLTFVDTAHASVTETLRDLDDLQGTHPRWVAHADQYADLAAQLEWARASYDVTNVSAALGVLLDIVKVGVESLRDGWYDVAEEAEKRDTWVPSASLGLADMPADAAATIARAIDMARQNGDVNHPWQLIEMMAAEYLAQ